MSYVRDTQPEVFLLTNQSCVYTGRARRTDLRFGAIGPDGQILVSRCNYGGQPKIMSHVTVNHFIDSENITLLCFFTREKDASFQMI